MRLRTSLEVIEVANPCPADWNAMAGDDKSRFCTHCHKFVHNLSEMPSAEVERLTCEQAGSLCARFARDPHTNQIVTLDYAPRPKGTRRRAIWTVASMLAAIGFTGAWAAYKTLTKTTPPPAMMIAGRIQLPPPPPLGP